MFFSSKDDGFVENKQSKEENLDASRKTANLQAIGDVVKRNDR